MCAGALRPPNQRTQSRWFRPLGYQCCEISALPLVTPFCPRPTKSIGLPTFWNSEQLDLFNFVAEKTKKKKKEKECIFSTKRNDSRKSGVVVSHDAMIHIWHVPDSKGKSGGGVDWGCFITLQNAPTPSDAMHSVNPGGNARATLILCNPLLSNARSIRERHLMGIRTHKVQCCQIGPFQDVAWLR